jgi:hypothetical protein
MTRAFILALVLSGCATALPIDPATYLGVRERLGTPEREPCPAPKISINNVCRMEVK